MIEIDDKELLGIIEYARMGTPDGTLIAVRDWFGKHADDEFGLYNKLDYLAQEYCTWLHHETNRNTVAAALSADDPIGALNGLSNWCAESGRDTLAAKLDEARDAFFAEM